jgi:hypothetical protein
MNSEFRGQYIQLSGIPGTVEFSGIPGTGSGIPGTVYSIEEFRENHKGSPNLSGRKRGLLFEILTNRETYYLTQSRDVANKGSKALSLCVLDSWREMVLILI